MTRSTAALDSEVETRLALALTRAPRALSDDELRIVLQRVERSLRLRDALRTVRLANGDAPAFAFDPAPWEPLRAKESIS
jgi:hypothetical protein